METISASTATSQTHTTERSFINFKMTNFAFGGSATFHIASTTSFKLARPQLKKPIEPS
jgi:hypothetical protein